MAYEFEGFRLDTDRRRLLAAPSGEPIQVSPKVLETLVYLVERRGELVEKDALMKAIWPRVVVEENNLDRNISTLRRVLGEKAGENRFIATVPGRGYRFVAEITTRRRGTRARRRRGAGRVAGDPCGRAREPGAASDAAAFRPVAGRRRAGCVRARARGDHRLVRWQGSRTVTSPFNGPPGPPSPDLQQTTEQYRVRRLP